MRSPKLIIQKLEDEAKALKQGADELKAMAESKMETATHLEALIEEIKADKTPEPSNE